MGFKTRGHNLRPVNKIQKTKDSFCHIEQAQFIHSEYDSTYSSLDKSMTLRTIDYYTILKLPFQTSEHRAPPTDVSMALIPTVP